MRCSHAISAALALVLAGCGTSTVSQPTTAPVPAFTGTPTTSVPTTAPTAVPTSATPTAAPTAIPAGVLPAPLYFNERGQLFQVATDGTTRTPIGGTAGPDGLGGIGEFAISPVDGDLVYLEQRLVDGRSRGALVRAGADGRNPQILLEGDYFTSPRWSPDGRTIAFGVLSLIGGPPPTLEPGTYLIPATGGAPQLLQASEPGADPGSLTRAYVPQAWSPAGDRLLLKVFLLESGGCELRVLPRDGGPAVAITPPEGLILACESATWRTDGAAIAMNVFRPGSGALQPGLWQASAATGALSMLVAPQGPAGWTVVSGISAAADGGWLAFVATTAEPPVEGQLPELQMARITADGAITVLRPERYALGWDIDWAPDQSGVSVQRIGAGVQPTLLWLPITGNPVELYTTDLGLYSGIAWGR